jgi:hypothetical protein
MRGGAAFGPTIGFDRSAEDSSLAVFIEKGIARREVIVEARR